MRLMRSSAVAAIVLAALAATAPRPARAATAAQLARQSSSALNRLYGQQSSARMLGKRAKAILVFPEMTKAGFLFGGQIGEGALLKGGRAVAYYNSVAASYGLQAGVQTFAYALFFMTDAALENLDTTAGFEVGVGPSFVIVDEGMGRSLTTSTIRHDVYAFIFGQKGLMAGMGLQGSKITRIEK